MADGVSSAGVAPGRRDSSRDSINGPGGENRAPGVAGGKAPEPSDRDMPRRSWRFGADQFGSTLTTDRIGKTRSEGSFWELWPSWRSEAVLHDEAGVGESAGW